MNKSTLWKRSVLVLIVANLIPIWGVIFWSWEVENILHLYWAENVAVGLVSALKILSNRHEKATVGTKVFLTGFFTVHYGFFCFGHAMFVFGGLVSQGPGFGDPAALALDYLRSHPTLILAFLASHLFSYFTNYLGKGEVTALDPGQVMFQPYRRIFVLHFTIVIGGIALVALGSPVVLILVLVIAKTGGDLYFHLREHQDAPTGSERV